MGESVGDCDGETVGDIVGVNVGERDGEVVGEVEGEIVGEIVGENVVSLEKTRKLITGIVSLFVQHRHTKLPEPSATYVAPVLLYLTRFKSNLVVGQAEARIIVSHSSDVYGAEVRSANS